MPTATLDLTRLTYAEWLNLGIAMNSALGSAMEYAAQNDRHDDWLDEMVDIHADVVALTGKPHAPEAS